MSRRTVDEDMVASLEIEEARASKRTPEPREFLSPEEFKGRVEAYGKWITQHGLKDPGPTLFTDGKRAVRAAHLHKPLLQRAKLDQAHVYECDWIEANLAGTDLTGSDFSGSRLLRANLDGAIAICATFQRSMVTDAQFTNARLHRADFREARLRNSSFHCARAINADFRGADLRLASMSAMEVYEANFTGATGLHGPESATEMGSVVGAEHAIFGARWDKMHWERLRLITTLHLFTASNVAFVGIITYSTAMRWYNTHVAHWHAWGESRQESPEPFEATVADLVSRVPYMPVQWHFGLLLLALFALSVATTLYALRCPQLVKENTETRWTRELNKPLIEYRSAKYHAIRSRYVCFVLFVIGGAYAGVYALWRAVVAFLYLITS